MKISLMEYTNNAKELLIFSKKTRIRMSPRSWADVLAMPDEEKDKELKYVFGTIGSSWEFVSYVFLIQGVTRAFTHQLVRHRVGISFAQQAQRVVDMTDFEYLATGDCEGNEVYSGIMAHISEGYHILIEDGVKPQDARGVLPTNVLTNILMKVNLRTLSGLLNIRLCVKAQGEFQGVARRLREEVLMVHPWADQVLQVHCVQYGSCIFPSFGACPIKQKGLLPKVDTKAIYDVWLNDRLEVQSLEDK